MLARHAVFTRAESCEHVTRVNMIHRHVYMAGHVKTRRVFDIMQKCVNTSYYVSYDNLALAKL